MALLASRRCCSSQDLFSLHQVAAGAQRRPTESWGAEHMPDCCLAQLTYAACCPQNSTTDAHTGERLIEHV